MLTHKYDSCFMQNVLRVVQIKGFVRTLERTDLPLLGEFDWISCFEKKYSWNCCHTVYSNFILDLDFRLRLGRVGQPVHAGGPRFPILCRNIFNRGRESYLGVTSQDWTDLLNREKVLGHNIQQHSAKSQLIWSEKELIDDIVYYHIYIQCYFDLECSFVQWDSRIRNFSLIFQLYEDMNFSLIQSSCRSRPMMNYFEISARNPTFECAH